MPSDPSIHGSLSSVRPPSPSLLYPPIYLCLVLPPRPPNLDRPSRGIHPSSPDPSSVFLHPRFLPPLPAFPVSPNTNALPLSTLSSTTTIVHPFLFFSFSLFFPPLFLLLPDLFPIRRSILLFPPSPPPPFPRCPTIFPSSSPTPSFSFLHGFPHCLFAPRQNREHGYTLFPLPSALSLSVRAPFVPPPPLEGFPFAPARGTNPARSRKEAVARILSTHGVYLLSTAFSFIHPSKRSG